MPNRILKESICTSDSIDELNWFEEVLFYRLIVNCDDFGRFDGRSAVIKNRLFPLKDSVTLKNVEIAINKLVRAGLVSCYKANEKPFLFLPTWNDHQSVRAKKSKYPEPEIICNQMQADVTVIQSNAKSNPNPNTNAKSAERASARGDYGWVKLTDEQMEKLVADLGELEAMDCIRYIDESAQGTSNKNGWKDWNLIVRKCHREGWHKKARGSEKGKQPDYQPTTERIKKNGEWLDDFLAGQQQEA